MNKKLKTETMDLFSEGDNGEITFSTRSKKETPQEKTRADELETIIEALDTLYEAGDDCVNPITGEITTDNEYDMLKIELFKIRPDSYIFKTVTASQSKLSGKKIIHNPPMTSISKCNAPTHEEKGKILLKWFEDCMGNKTFPAVCSSKKMIHAKIDSQDFTFPEDFFVMSYKHDGIAVSIEYNDGKLVRAGLRSKSGKDGIDVTEKMRYIEGVPLTLPEKFTGKIRGELETLKSVFEDKNKKLDVPFKNPRAYTAGSMNLKELDEFKERGIRFAAYKVIMDAPPYSSEIGMAKFGSKLGFHYVYTLLLDINKLDDMEKKHRSLDYLVDGVVLSVNRLDIQEEIGTVGDKDTGNPKGKIAWKFADEVAEIKVKDIVWQTGRTGNLTPVLIFDGVQLEGTTVSKCTAHNLGFMYQNEIEKGSTIEIIKSGKIIPKVHKVIKSPNWNGKVTLPKNCPSCFGSVHVEAGGSADTSRLVCKNPLCPAQNIKTLNHFLSTVGVKGISESTITKLIDAGFIQSYADFYRLDIDSLLNAGFTERTAILIVARIWMVTEPEQIKDNTDLRKEIIKLQKNKISIPANKFFAAFGISNAGKEVGRLLMQNCKSWEEIRDISEKDLLEIGGIGLIIASEIPLFFKEKYDIVKDVEQYFNIEFTNRTGKLSGKTFVLSGSLDGGKEIWKEKIEDAGGTVKTSVGKTVNYVVAGDGSGLKSEKAKELKIPILSIKDLERML